MLIVHEKTYEPQPFETDGELASVVFDHSDFLFGRESVYCPGKHLRLKEDWPTVPDGVCLLLKSRKWFVVRSVLVKRGIWSQIAPQADKLHEVVSRADSRAMLLERLVDQIKGSAELRDRFDEVGIHAIDIRQILSDILETRPLLGLAIDAESDDLCRWAGQTAYEARLWVIRRFRDPKRPDEPVFEIPELAGLPPIREPRPSPQPASENAAAERAKESHRPLAPMRREAESAPAPRRDTEPASAPARSAVAASAHGPTAETTRVAIPAARQFSEWSPLDSPEPTPLIRELPATPPPGIPRSSTPPKEGAAQREAAPSLLTGRREPPARDAAPAHVPAAPPKTAPSQSRVEPRSEPVQPTAPASSAETPKPSVAEPEPAAPSRPLPDLEPLGEFVLPERFKQQKYKPAKQHITLRDLVEANLVAVGDTLTKLYPAHNGGKRLFKGVVDTGGAFRLTEGSRRVDPRSPEEQGADLVRDEAASWVTSGGAVLASLREKLLAEWSRHAAAGSLRA